MIETYIDGDLANGLCRISVKQHATLRADLTDLADRMDRADLIVSPHDRDQNRVVAKGIA